MSEKYFSDNAGEGNVRETVFLTRQRKMSENYFSDNAGEGNVRETVFLTKRQREMSEKPFF